MILLADGGSTKTEWRLVDKGNIIVRLSTKGTNPFFRDREDIASELGEKLKPAIGKNRVDSVYFYGAGCTGADKNETIRAAIADNIKAARIEIGSDLLAAARGLCGDRPGIACILGTGSNSCSYDGVKIVENIPPLGFILGDEGSGAALGRLFIGACLKNQLTPGIRESFLSEFGLTLGEILENVYRRPMPNRFLASFAPFIKGNIADPTIYSMVSNAFGDFFRRNVMQYDYANNEVRFTGSIAFHFSDILRETGAGLGLGIGEITASPMEGLTEYHSKRQTCRL